LYVPVFENYVTTNVYSFYMSHLNAVLKQKNVICSWPYLDIQFGYTDRNDITVVA